MIMPILQTRKLKHEDKRLAWVSTVSRAGILETEALGKNQRPCWKLLLPPGRNSNLNLPAGLSPPGLHDPAPESATPSGTSINRGSGWPTLAGRATWGKLSIVSFICREPVLGRTSTNTRPLSVYPLSQLSSLTLVTPA